MRRSADDASAAAKAMADRDLHRFLNAKPLRRGDFKDGWTPRHSSGQARRRLRAEGRGTVLEHGVNEMGAPVVRSLRAGVGASFCLIDMISIIQTLDDWDYWELGLWQDADLHFLGCEISPLGGGKIYFHFFFGGRGGRCSARRRVGLPAVEFTLI